MCWSWTVGEFRPPNQSAYAKHTKTGVLPLLFLRSKQIHFLCQIFYHKLYVNKGMALEKAPILAVLRESKYHR